MYVDEFSNIIDEIKENRILFEIMLEEIKMEKDFEKQQHMSIEAIKFALKNSTGYYSSDIIENVFLKAARTNLISIPIKDYKKNTFLHIMTACYETGGHTRVVERWIEAGENNEEHSLLITDSDSSITKRLENAIKYKNGKIVILSNELSPVEKAMQLRKVASEYEYVILHVHMFDVIPIIAFGNEQFKRPVILFNHADHKFWVGVSIADVVAEFRSWGYNISRTRRSVVSNFVLGLPLDKINEKLLLNKKQCRENLKLSIDTPIIVSVGTPHKYKPIGDVGLLSTIEKILDRNRQVELIIIGGCFKDLAGWGMLSKKFNNRIKAIGKQTPDKIFEYFNAADLVLDSFPMSGGVALLDAVSCKKPVLSLYSPTGQLDYILNSDAYCIDDDSMIEKTLSILENPSIARENQNNVWKELNKYLGKEIWKENVQLLYKSVNTHNINFFKTDREVLIDDLDEYLWSENRNIKRKLSIQNVIEIYKIKKHGKKYLFFKVFNKFKMKFVLKHR